jgi:DNA-binding response OmpR family regulator
MSNRALSGRSILVVEDEPLVALHVVERLQEAGARVFTVGELRGALHMAEHPALSAAVVDFRLGDKNSAAVCRRLAYLGIPFMFYTGCDAGEAGQIWPHAPILRKPAGDGEIIGSVVKLLN